MSDNNQIYINNHIYPIPKPGQTYVAMCFDGTSEDYVRAAMAAGKMPNTQQLLSSKRGHMELAMGAMPTYTNPNNVSIMTGVEPDQHGISGNFYYQQTPTTTTTTTTAARGENVMMTSPTLIRADSIFAQLYNADPDNTMITIITSKDKLKQLLLHQLPNNYTGSFLPTLHGAAPAATAAATPTNGVTIEYNPNVRAFSVEGLQKYKNELPEIQYYIDLVNTTFTSPDDVQLSAPPTIYDPANSVYNLQLGYALYKNDQKQLSAERLSQMKQIFYLTTTDYVQHQYPPGHPIANELLFGFDQVIGKFSADGAIVGFTADHGMSDKATESGAPNILFVAEHLDALFQTLPPALIDAVHHTILPITDPYIAHHGSLGGYATIYVESKQPTTPLSDEDKAQILSAIHPHFRNHPACRQVLTREEAVVALKLPADRIGDVVVIGVKDVVLGTRGAEHDLTQLHSVRLRSHGSLDEAEVPLFINQPVVALKKRESQVRNFDLLLNLFEC